MGVRLYYDCGLCIKSAGFAEKNQNAELTPDQNVRLIEKG